MKISSYAGIIAAGCGLRLVGAYPTVPKPLTLIRGKPLVHWVAGSLYKSGVRSLVVLLNSAGKAVQYYLENCLDFKGLNWTFLRQDTASSWESFWIVSHHLAAQADQFMISTVDALIPPDEALRFSRQALTAWQMPGGGPKIEPWAGIALTKCVDDEKPLWADIDATDKAALGPNVKRRELATCGLYALTAETTQQMPKFDYYRRLRDYWVELAEFRPVRGVLLRESVDVDRPQDLIAAEKVTSCFDA